MPFLALFVLPSALVVFVLRKALSLAQGRQGPAGPGVP